MNRALRRISIAVLVMFVLLLINVNYLQGFSPASLATKPNNARAFEAQFQYQRGSIVTSDGVTIADSVPSSDVYKFQRKYPHGAEYAPVTGYDTLYSETGIEYYENSVLNGSDSSLTVRNFIDLLTGKPRKGANVTLTINARDQDAAWNALAADSGGKPGAVVALNPQTGAILAMASYPSYNPSVFLSPAKNAGKLYKDTYNQPLIDKTLEPKAPGSTFKPITATAAWNSGVLGPGTTLDCPGVFYRPGDFSHTPFPNWTTANLGTMNLPTALEGKPRRARGGAAGCGMAAADLFEADRSGMAAGLRHPDGDRAGRSDRLADAAGGRLQRHRQRRQAGHAAHRQGAFGQPGQCGEAVRPGPAARPEPFAGAAFRDPPGPV